METEFMKRTILFWGEFFRRPRKTLIIHVIDQMMNRFAIILIMILISSCSADIPPYDKSVTWKKITDPVPQDEGWDFTFLRITGDNRIYASKHEFLCYSTDGGNHWTEIPVPDSIFDKRYFVNYDGNLYMIGGGKFYGSTDMGISWKEITYPVNGTFLQHPSGHLFMVSYEGLYRTTDFGVSWHERPAPRNKNNGVYMVFVADNGDLMTNVNQSLYYSTDEGAVWDSMPAQPSAVSLYGLYPIYPNSASRLVAAIHNTITADNELYQTTDLGQNWSNLGFGVSVSDVIWESGFPLLISGSGGVYRRHPEGLFSQVNTGLPYEPDCYTEWCFVRALFTDTAGAVYANTSDGVYRSEQTIREMDQ